MGRIVNLSGTLRPTAKMRHYQKCRESVSESSKARLIATRTIIGHTVHFYETGEHVIETISESDLSTEEMFNSEILKFAHASLIAGIPIGDKNLTWVDCSNNPCEVWMFGKTTEQFLTDVHRSIKNGRLDPNLILDGKTVETMREANHV